MIENDKRLIGRFTGEEDGPLLICLAGIHGNEQAGLKALDLIFKMVEVEPVTNPAFKYKGRIVGFRGNIAAINTGQRFVDRDLNRMWTKKEINRIQSADHNNLLIEEGELNELLEDIKQEIKTYQPNRIVVLDLHTTSSEGGIFSIVTDDEESIQLGLGLHAPVVLGLEAGLIGTTVRYFHHLHRNSPMSSISFESGSHEDPLSVNRAIAAVINCMRAIGSVQAAHVENRHDQLLIEHGQDLPRVVRLGYVHKVESGDQFVMNPGFKNFDWIEKGRTLATDKRGVIRAQQDGFLLMPLYQKQGEDGFFIVHKDRCPLGKEFQNGTSKQTMSV